MTSTKEITVTVNNKQVTLVLYATAYYDSNYGADADGNRGMGVWFLEDVTWDLPDIDDDGNTLSDSEKKMVDGLLNLSVDDIEWE